MRANRIVLASIALLFGTATGAAAQTATPRVYSPQDEGAFAPAVDVWLNQLEYNFGDRIRPLFVSEPGAFVTVVRVSTDGELRVLYPRRPSAQQPYAMGSLAGDRVPFSGEAGFALNESSGTGFVFAIASNSRFNYRYYTVGDSWSYARLAASGRFSDPFEAVRFFIDRTLDERADFSMDYAAYEVYSGGVRSRYASRSAYYSTYDYVDACYNAFGYRTSYYCRGYYSSYGPFVTTGGGTPSPTARKRMKGKPLVPDPVLPPIVPEAQPAQGRFRNVDRAEAAAMARRERMLRDERPRVEMRTEPRIMLPQGVDRQPQVRSEPQSRPQPRSESVRSEPRYQPQPRSESVRSEPRAQAAPARVEAPRERPQPKTDN